MLDILLDNTTLVIAVFFLNVGELEVPATNPLTGFPLYLYGITTAPLGDVLLSPATRYEFPFSVNVSPVVLAVLVYKDALAESLREAFRFCSVTALVSPSSKNQPEQYSGSIVDRYSPKVWPDTVLEATVTGELLSICVTIFPFVSLPTLNKKFTPASKSFIRPVLASIVPVPPLAIDRTTEYSNVSPAVSSQPLVPNALARTLLEPIVEANTIFGLWSLALVPLSAPASGVLVTLIFSGVRLLFLT